MCASRSPRSPDPIVSRPSTTFAAWLQQGQSLESCARYDEAIAAYDQALAVSANEPRAESLAWMNRGNALQKRAAGDTEEGRRLQAVREAVAAYDAAIELLRALPFDQDPVIRNQLGAAWLNRGHALIEGGEAGSAAESFQQAIALLAALPIAENPHYRLNLAGAWTNFAHVLLTASPAGARAAARSALELLAEVERTHPAFAEMSLRARRALVMANGEALHRGTPEFAMLAGEASDAIDEGLALARECERRGVSELRPLAARLFRLGTQIYRLHQPHFLAEFVLENLAPEAFGADAEFRSAADEALALTLAQLQRPQVLTVGDVASTRLLETARSIREAQQQLSSSSISSVPAS